MLGLWVSAIRVQGLGFRASDFGLLVWGSKKCPLGSAEVEALKFSEAWSLEAFKSCKAKYSPLK